MAIIDRASPCDISPLQPGEFEQIRRLAYRTCGLDLRSGKEDLVNSRLLRLVREGGFRSFYQYYRNVLEDPTGVALAHMIDALETNHTSFLREPDHFDFLRAHARDLASSHALEVWSAGCSTGEEVWSLACLLDEILPATPVHIWGTDISNTALRTARDAVYTSDRCRELPLNWLRRYFEPEGQPPRHYRVSAAIRARAAFRRVNLIQPHHLAHRFSFIFCRNVMIYFDPPTQQAVVHQLEQALEPGGYLFIGHAESLSRVSHSLEHVQPAIFRRPGAKGRGWPWK